ncbi:MAG: sigma-54 dependent transcriptional regulator [Terracidiphilus sp.]|jgi:DNA-binding NtrC family response regulator
MQTVPVPVFTATTRIRPRTALVASTDSNFRQRLTEILTGLRWRVREVEGGAQAWGEAQISVPDAVIVDSWLPDLDLSEFLKDFRHSYPEVDLMTTGSYPVQESPRGPYRQELLYALRRCQDTDTASWNAAPALSNPVLSPADLRPVETATRVLASLRESLRAPAGPEPGRAALEPAPGALGTAPAALGSAPAALGSGSGKTGPVLVESANRGCDHGTIERLPELIGNAACMLEVSRRIRLVAPRVTPVLIEGPTGSGKELVAEALHRLSPRSRKSFVALNCAAIPEALLEAELFGHTRGAFTGAVHGRVGRIEAADGGTLFLDEIGEMPLGLQSKLLRFVECGELQRVGDNETVKVDVRIVAATHQALAQQAQEGKFRSDLYYRLAVFLIRTPALAEHSEDLPLLVNHFLEKMGREEPVKRVDPGAMAKLAAHDWPGNVRELEHVLERAAILAGDDAVLTSREIDFGLIVN